MQNPHRPYLSLISWTTKLTTVAIMLDVTTMVACAVLLPHSQVRDPLIFTAAAFVVLVIIFFYSLFYDAEVISNYFERLEAIQTKAAIERVAAERSENNPVSLVVSSVVGITDVKLLDEELLLTTERTRPWILTKDNDVFPPEPAVLRMGK